MSELAIHTHVPNPFLYICFILKKAQKMGISVAVLFDNEEDLHAVDNMLWTFDQQSFIPHARTGSPTLKFGGFQLAMSPEELPQTEMLVIASRNAPSDINALLAKFPKVIDIVGTQEPFISLGRHRWKIYRMQGIQPVIHDRSKGT